MARAFAFDVTSLLRVGVQINFLFILTATTQQISGDFSYQE